MPHTVQFNKTSSGLRKATSKPKCFLLNTFTYKLVVWIG